MKTGKPYEMYFVAFTRIFICCSPLIRWQLFKLLHLLGVGFQLVVRDPLKSNLLIDREDEQAWR